MIKETYRGYSLSASPVKGRNGRWAVAVTISRSVGEKVQSETFHAHDGIEYILEIEAAKEGLNLGKNLINLNRVAF